MNKEIFIIPKTLAILMLTVATFPLPYDYYILLRWVVCGTSLYLAYYYHVCKKTNMVWIFGLMALFFNPLFPLHLLKSTWVIIDIIAAWIFFISLFIKVSNYTDKKG